MEVVEHRNFMHDHGSDRQSFSNNVHAGSQSRKVSIGITVEAFAKSKLESRKEDIVLFPATKNKVTCPFSEARLLNKEVGIKAASEVNPVGIPSQQTNALFSAPTLHSNMATGKTVELFAEKTSVLQPDVMVLTKFNSIGYCRKSENNQVGEKVEEVTFVAAHNVSVSGKGEREDKRGNVSKGNEALRKKLWEILETAPSQNEHLSELQAHASGADNLNSGRREFEKDEPSKHDQNTDTIETDSTNPNQIVRRPITRSCSRKKSQTKMQLNVQSKNNAMKLKNQENNIFTFDEAERTGNLNWPVKKSLTRAKRKFNEITTRIQPRRICFPQKSNSENQSHSFGRESSPPQPEKPQHCNTKASSSSTASPPHSPPNKNENEQKDLENCPPSKTADLQKCLFRPSVPKNTKLDGDFDTPMLPISAGSKEKYVSPSPNSPQVDCQCPTFAKNALEENDFLSAQSPNKTPEVEEIFTCSFELLKRIQKTKGCCSSRNFQTSSPVLVGRTTCSWFSSDNKGSTDSPMGGSIYVEGNDVKKMSAEVHDPESAEEDEVTVKGVGAKGNCLPGTSCHKKPPSVHRRRQRFCSQEGLKLSGIDLASPYPKGNEESNGLDETTEQIEENGLDRAFSHFALVLGKFETKMKSQGRKESSEILASVSHRIHLHLQSTESHIQTEMKKFRGYSKSKRKHLESRFQEQQEHLKFIQEKFKEEISQHLKDYRTTLEEFEVYQTELRGQAEKQKASNEKLLLQAEEAIDVQLGDAERKIEAIHKVARKRMQGLKVALTEFFREGLLS